MPEVMEGDDKRRNEQEEEKPIVTVTLQSRIRAVLTAISAATPPIGRGVHGYPQYLQGNAAGTIPTLNPLCSKHHSSIIFPLELPLCRFHPSAAQEAIALHNHELGLTATCLAVRFR
jgi:hypothetical protein